MTSAPTPPARIVGLGDDQSVRYLHLPAGSLPLPVLDERPFKAVVVVEQTVDEDWQYVASEWLIRSGCLYMVAWGWDCVRWADSVDWARRHVHGKGDIPDDVFAFTTWHTDEPLSEAFWYAVHAAWHPTVDLSHVLIIDIYSENRSSQMLAAFEQSLVEID